MTRWTSTGIRSRSFVSDRLLVIDGHNVVLRAYFGLIKQGLRTREGVGTWGLYGAINSVSSYVRKYEPTHVLIALDSGRSSKRVALYPEYKANRVSNQTPDDNYQESRQQVNLFQEFCELAGFTLVREKNVEADDIIAKVVTSNRESFEQIVIVSSDHDIRQLISENTIVVKPSLGQSRDVEEQVFDRDYIINEYGREPKLLPEIWALTGDRGDNVPGVPGVGEKTALKLLNTHNDLWQLLESDEKKIADHKDTIRLAYQLVQLDGQDEISGFPQLDQLKFNPVVPYDEKSLELLHFFDKYELNSIKTRWSNGFLWEEETPFGRKLNEQN